MCPIIAKSRISFNRASIIFSTNADYKGRITFKLIEHDCEKLLFCCDLCDKYFKILEKTDARIEETKQRLLAEGDKDEFEQYSDEENQYIQAS